MRQTIEENKEWIQFFIAILTIASFLLMARSDYHHLDTRIDAIHEEINAIHQEMKDFHGRLCAIEERRANK